jgi:hypothetical protein
MKLEHLAAVDKVYLDTNIMNLDNNRDEDSHRIGGGFAKRIGKARSFQDLAEQQLRRQKRYCQDLGTFIRGNSNVVATPEVVAEHHTYVRHLRNTLAYFTRHSKGRNKKKSMLLTMITTESSLSNATLNARAIGHTSGTEGIIDYLMTHRMHESYDGKWEKIFAVRDKKTSFVDAGLVAQALAESGEYTVRIFSADTDVINLVRNFSGKYKSIAPLFPGLRPERVEVYLPCPDTWHPHRNVNLVVPETLKVDVVSPSYEVQSQESLR